MLYIVSAQTKAYFDGTRVLIDGGKTFRDSSATRTASKLIKKPSSEVSGGSVPIGPYEEPKTAASDAPTAEQSLCAGKAGAGVELKIVIKIVFKEIPPMKARMPTGYGRPDPNAMMRQAQKMQDRHER